MKEMVNSNLWARRTITDGCQSRQRCTITQHVHSGTGSGRYGFATSGKISVALLSQSRAIDTSRLHEKIGYASESDFKAIKEGVIGLLS
jgi:mRNA-degrading endonuclease toxin of MazEF toxin-antitoxin module